MKMRKLFLILFLALSCCSLAQADVNDNIILQGSSDQSSVAYRVTMTWQFIKSLEKYGKIGAGLAFVLGGLYVVSIMQKENPDFFATVTRGLEWPFFITQRKLQHFYCNGKSLTWNEIASWHNRVSRLLTPLTKSTSVIDLSKDRRLRTMDGEDDKNGVQDVQWMRQVAHIEKEFLFLKKVLQYRFNYYTDLETQNKTHILKSVGKNIVRTSLNRNEEIAFGLEEAMSYLDETVVYCKSVSSFSTLDKEHLKRLMGNICTVCEHLGVLVDEVSAADRTKKKIPMSADGGLTRGYAGSGGGAYSEGYGAYGSGGLYNV